MLAMPLVFSCHGVEPDVDPVPVEPQPETRTLTFTLPSYEGEVPAAMKSAWVPGDKIVVHGEYAKQQVIVTLESSDISSDGRSATKTVDGLMPYVREDCKSSLYAEYPAEAVDNLKHCFFYSKFSDTNKQLLAASDEGDTFKFHDVCGVVSFDIDEDFDSYTITGLRKEAMGYEFLQVKLTDAEQNFLQYVGEPVITLSGPMKRGKNMIYMPGDLSLSGCIIKFKKGDSYKSILKYTEAIRTERGKVSDMGDITSLVAAYDDPFSADIKDLDAEGNANCYIVTAPGKYKFKAVKGNSSVSYFDDISDAEVLWETWNNADEVASHSVVAAATYAEDYIIVTMPDAVKPGNAVVAAKDADGKILWSWHIWVPETSVANAAASLFKTGMMDRNLGALRVAEASSTPLAPECFGMMYQWGRKDPYTGGQAVSSSSPATVAGVKAEVAPGQITLEQSIANPTLLGHMDNGDWLKEADGTLWVDDHKTVYDPCPPGYRVPSSSTCTFWSDLSKVAGWGFDKVNGWFKLGDPVCVFPLVGYRDDYGVGSIAHGYDRGLYLSSGASSDKPGYARAEDVRPGSSISFKETPKSRAGFVRCVTE